MTAAQAAAGQPVFDERKAPPAAVVIFGASGDLTARKLGPALENLARHKRIPAEFGVVGVARTQWTLLSSGLGWPVRKAR
jgi:glucose-6-phosphate 1-dehydrogenase